MTFLKSLALAFTMYSKIPMPRVSWEGKHQQYVLACFPLVGVVVGGVEFFWLWLFRKIGLGVFLSGAVAAVLPIALTGGIHLDGFCDTCDALASHQPKERKLEILKDSHVGAFALIGLGVYLLLTFGVWAQIVARPFAWREALAVCLVFPFERALSGFWCVTLPNARGGGMLFHFTGETTPKVVRALLIVQGLLAGWGFCFACIDLARWMVPLILLGSIWFQSMAEKQFGGITGDLAGWFLQVTELLALLGAAIGGCFL